MELQCQNNSCPAGSVIIKPKDNGIGSDRDEIHEACTTETIYCPLCEDVMAVAEEE